MKPRQFTPVLAEGELGTEPRQVQAHGIAVVLARAGGVIYALGEHCPHRGPPHPPVPAAPPGRVLAGSSTSATRKRPVVTDAHEVLLRNVRAPGGRSS
jgi:nitrite reductase/ring-hydroxylating ferredoxin subunit